LRYLVGLLINWLQAQKSQWPRGQELSNRCLTMNGVPAEGLHKDVSNLRVCPQACPGIIVVSEEALTLCFVQWLNYPHWYMSKNYPKDQLLKKRWKKINAILPMIKEKHLFEYMYVAAFIVLKYCKNLVFPYYWQNKPQIN
jgi:hypothetical protein